MPTDPRQKPGKTPRRDPWRSLYRLSAEQVGMMVEHGILPQGKKIELWDGILYRLARGELQNVITAAIADAIRRAVPEGYQVRKEKPCSFGARSLPVLDVAVCRTGAADFPPKPPDLARLALVVEVDQTTKPHEQDDRHRRYAEAKIPVYWQVGAEDRLVSVYRKPEGVGEDARYRRRESYGLTREIPIVIDDREVGRVAVADIFPSNPPEAKP